MSDRAVPRLIAETTGLFRVRHALHTPAAGEAHFTSGLILACLL